jgi:hypothetical protein
VTDPAGGADGGGAGALINGAFSRTTSSTQAGVECALGVSNSGFRNQPGVREAGQNRRMTAQVVGGRLGLLNVQSR